MSTRIPDPQPPIPNPPTPRPLLLLVVALLAVLLLAGCSLRRRVIIHVDGQRHTLSTEAATVGQALQEAGITLGPLDRVEPKPWEEIGRGATIIVTRVTEELSSETRPLPYQRQQVRDEALPEGVSRLIQLGVNGTEVLTYSIRFEEGNEVGRRLVERKVVGTPQPEIVVEGVRGALPAVPVTGTLAYISNGNAWTVRGSTEQKQPLTFSGDLDGRVFSLSPDGRWLLFTRRPLGGQAGRGGPLNTLWVVNTRIVGETPRPLEAEGVLYAQWSAGSTHIAYSTAERTIGSPGWRARNDLWIATLEPTSVSPEVSRGAPEGSGRAGTDTTRRIVPPRSDLPYAWWGVGWAWSPDGARFAFAQADTVGLLDVHTREMKTLIRFAPYHTYASWVWVPHLAWSPDGQLLAVPLHLSPAEAAGLAAPTPAAEDSSRFGLGIFRPDRNLDVLIADQVGMWTWPSWSPRGTLAFGIARQPSASEHSVYDLYVMDADGSNRRRLFPPEGAPGLDIPEAAWSPTGGTLAVTWQDDVYLVDAGTGQATRITANGHSNRAQWAR